MMMAVSTATPASAMNPTSTATEISKLRYQISQTPPASATGKAARMIATSVTRLKAMNSINVMISSVAGATNVSRSCIRSMYSYCPDHVME